jgi:hypothetical protein
MAVQRIRLSVFKPTVTFLRRESYERVDIKGIGIIMLVFPGGFWGSVEKRSSNVVGTEASSFSAKRRDRSLSFN